jgi:HEAT repeat protein
MSLLAIFAAALTVAEQPIPAIRYDGKTIDEWRAMINKPNFSATEVVSPDFPLLRKPDPGAIPLLLALLKDKEPKIRVAALTCLGSLNTHAGPVVPEIVKALNDPSDYVQISAIRTLEALGTAAVCSAPELLRLMREKDDFTQLACARALLAIGVSREEVDSRVATLLSTSSVRRSGAILYELFKVASRIPDPSDRLIEALIEAASADEKLLSDLAIERLGKVRPQTKKMTDVFVRSLNSRHASVRVEACKVLWDSKSDPEPLVPALTSAIGDPSIVGSRLRDAIGILRAMGPRARASLPALRSLVEESSDPVIRDMANAAIVQIDR